MEFKSSSGKKSKQRKSKGENNSKTAFKMALHLFIYFLHLVVDAVVDFICRLIYDDANRRLLTPIKHSFLVESATSLAEKIRTKQLSSEKLVTCCIERIQEVNADLNCVVDMRFEEALEEARKADQFIATTSLSSEELKNTKPFLGVPFTSKESTHAAGMSITFGLVSRRGLKAREDADIVARMKAAGGILLAVTNVPELNLWWETRNNVFGQTNNPYNVHRLVGGSSGGEAACIAACGSPLGIGTDIGGSIRMPCFFCGIYGHKPTTGLISVKGMTYRTGEEKGATMVTAGPMARHADDLTPLLKLLLADNVNKLKLDAKVDLKSIKLCYTTDPGDARVSIISAEMKSVMQQAVNHLQEESGSEARLLTLSGFKYSYKLWRYWMSQECGNFSFDLGNRKEEVSALVEVPKMLLGQSQHTLPAILKILESAVFPAVPATWAEAETTALKEQLISELGEDGVLLFPSGPTPAPHHYVPFFRPFNFAYWAVINVLHFPATQVPLGLSKDGLPLGIQVVAAPYNDHLCLAVARELERAFGGFVPPCAVQH